MTTLDLTEPALPVRWAKQPCTLKNAPALPFTFLGIDLSLTRTGVAVITDGVLQTGVLQPPAESTGGRRLAWFHYAFGRLLAHVSPYAVGIEGYAFGARAQHHKIGELGGVLRLVLEYDGRAYLIIPPTCLKNFATGSGVAEKSTVAKDLYKRFGVDLTNNDEVDAAGLALMTLAAYSQGTRLAATHRAALEKVERAGLPVPPVNPVAKTIAKASN